jgi:GNAT superfamily N-acetyltransferase
MHAEAIPSHFRSGVPPVPIDSFDELLATSTAAVLVAETNERVIGFVILKAIDTPARPILQPRRIAKVDVIAVDLASRGPGVGRALMDAATVWARTQGATDLELTVFEFNREALGFYEHLGMSTKLRQMTIGLDACMPLSRFPDSREETPMQQQDDATQPPDLKARADARPDPAIEDAIAPLVARIVDLEAQVHDLQDRLQDAVPDIATDLDGL